MTKGELERLVHDYFKPRSGYERIWCKTTIVPFAEKLMDKTLEKYKQQAEAKAKKCVEDIIKRK